MVEKKRRADPVENETMLQETDDQKVEVSEKERKGAENNLAKQGKSGDKSVITV